jgi:hypothetical protein
MSTEPTLLTRLAALVTALFLIPDFLLPGAPGNPTGPGGDPHSHALGHPRHHQHRAEQDSPLRWRPAVNVTPGHAARSV